VWRNCIMAVMMAVLVACGRDESGAAPAAGEWADLHAPVEIVDWALPSLRPGTHSPGLALTHDGRLLLSWVNSQRGRRHIFQFSSYDLARQQWRGAPFTVVIGNSLVTADNNRPQMAASRDGALWAQWLQTSGQEGVRDLMFSRSRDGGANWDEPQMPYPDHFRHRNGHVAVWPRGDHGLGMAWLTWYVTGNPTKAVSLHTEANVQFVKLADTGWMVEAWDSGCAAPTSAALTSLGPLLAFRGRTDDGAYDIHVVRRDDDDGWLEPVQVHADAARFSSCLDSGPVVAAHGEAAAVAWLTEEGGQWTVRMALSTDAGHSFSAPVEIVRNVDLLIHPFAVALDARQAWVLWTHMDAGGPSLWLSRRSLDLQKEYERREIARLTGATMDKDCIEGSACNTGTPQFVLHQSTGYLVWTETHSNAASTLRGVKILPAQGISPQ